MTTIHTDIHQPVEVRVDRTRARPTPAPAGRRFRDSLDEGAGVLLDGVESASGAMPGGTLVSAAVRGARAGAGGTADGPSVGGEAAQAPGGSGPTMEGALTEHANETMRYLELQQRISSENRRYTALSNVMKARHDTAKAAINNIR